MKRLLILLSLIVALPADAAVTATIDKNPVLIGEVIQLTVRSDRSKDDPELSTLEQDFQILNRSSSSQFQLINGKASRNYEWTFQLRPLTVGELAIPPITIDGESSQPIAVRVEKPNTQAGEWPEAFIEFRADKSEAWLREQVILDFKLFVRGDLVSGNFSPPSSAQAVIEALGEQEQTQEIKGNQRYKVIHQRYALFAEQSGTINISGPIFNGEVSLPGQRPSIFGLSRARRPIYAAGDPLSLTILAPPDNLGGAQWLPASNVVLSEELQPDTEVLKAGEPLTRIVRLQVNGQLHTQLPALDIDTPSNAQAYTEPAQDGTRSDGQQMIAIREYSTAIIPGKDPELVLPGLEIQWWNTTSNTLETARLAPRTLKVSSPPSPSATLSPPPQPAPTQQTASVTPPASTPPAQPGSLRFWQILAITCAAGWIGTVLAWFFAGRRPEKRPARDASTSQDEKQLRKTLSTASAQQAREALINWARVKSGRYQSLGSLAKLTDNEALKAALMSLDAAAFGHSADFDRAGILACLELFHQQKQQRAALPPLYPES